MDLKLIARLFEFCAQLKTMFTFNPRPLNCFRCLVSVQPAAKNGTPAKVAAKKTDESSSEEEDSGDESEEEVKVSVDFMTNHLITLRE